MRQKLQVAMDDALVVRGTERVGDLRAERERVRQPERTFVQAVGERLAVDELHDQKIHRDACRAQGHPRRVR